MPWSAADASEEHGRGRVYDDGCEGQQVQSAVRVTREREPVPAVDGGDEMTAHAAHLHATTGRATRGRAQPTAGPAGQRCNCEASNLGRGATKGGPIRPATTTGGAGTTSRP
jgi:hypothetical protein